MRLYRKKSPPALILSRQVVGKDAWQVELFVVVDVPEIWVFHRSQPHANGCFLNFQFTPTPTWTTAAAPVSVVGNLVKPIVENE